MKHAVSPTQILYNINTGNPKDIEAVVDFWQTEGVLTVSHTKFVLSNRLLTRGAGQVNKDNPQPLEFADVERLRESIPQSVLGNLREVFDQLSPNIQVAQPLISVALLISAS